MQTHFTERMLWEHVQITVTIDHADKPLWSVGIGGTPGDSGSCILAAEGRTLDVAMKRLIRAMRTQLGLVDQALAVPVERG